ncbi:MAG: ABC transporter permease subunit [Actinomycetota bacterium]|nr:ABC transporter permease subunit [Actinomycetota bacterium]
MALIRAELLKQRSTWTGLGLFAAMLCLVLLAVLLHGFGLPAEDLGRADVQLMMLGRGEFLGVLFAALLGAMSITAEIRHGTIRPTFLFSPRRRRVLASKISVSVLIGAGFGLVAGAVAAAVGTAALRARGIDVQLELRDYVLLVAGSVAAAALWAAIGVGVGALVRNQVPTLIGICAWLLLVEGLLAGDVAGGLGDVGRFLPGAAAAAISGQDPGTLLPPALGVGLLALYAIAAALAGSLATSRRDVG